MILIDSLYINNSGGLRLLEYLVGELEKRRIAFFLLADSRCLGLFDKLSYKEYLEASIIKRVLWYKKCFKGFSSVLCFGNIPPPIRLDVPVYTYFHNINLLTLAEARNGKDQIVMWLKRQVFRNYKHYTNYWLVQTSNTSTELTRNLKESNDKVKVVPFYDLPDQLLNMSYVQHGDDYVFVSNYTGAKGHEVLLEAWKLLHHCGLNKTLHLTVPSTATIFCEKIEMARKEGINVINHGFIPFNDVLDLYKQSKAIIYPSHNESLGLGIIEAITAGCDVIGADLPYIHAICEPSLVFDPYSANSIANAVKEYEKGETEKSELKIYNHINEMIDLLTVRN